MFLYHLKLLSKCMGSNSSFSRAQPVRSLGLREGKLLQTGEEVVLSSSWGESHLFENFWNSNNIPEAINAPDYFLNPEKNIKEKWASSNERSKRMILWK